MEQQLGGGELTFRETVLNLVNEQINQLREQQPSLSNQDLNNTLK